MCSLIEAMESAKECFNREKGLKAAHYYLTPVYTEAPYIMSDAELQAADGSATIIGVATLGTVPKDNTVDLTTSEGAVSTLMIHRLLHLTMNLVLVPPWLSCPMWTRMRRVKVQYESFICFPTSYTPPNISESECNSQQLALMEGLHIPKPGVLLALADQLDNLRMVPPGPKATPSQGTDIALRMRPPRRPSQQILETPPKKHHKSCEEKSQLKHSLMEKSLASSSCEHDVVHQASRLGDAVVQACLSIARMAKVVENTHNSKIVEALLVRQCLEKVSANAIDSVMDEILGAHTPADMWQVEKKISTHISCKRAKAYGALVEQHCSVSDLLTGKDGSGDWSSEMAEAEEEFHKSISNLISTIITEGAKVPGGHGVALTSNIIWLVPTLPLNSVLALSIDLPPEKECKITLGDTLRPFPAGHGTLSSLPSSPLTVGMGVPVATGRSTIKFGSGCDSTHCLCTTSYRLSLLQEAFKHQCPSTSKRVGSSKCIQLSHIERTSHITSRQSRYN